MSELFEIHISQRAFCRNCQASSQFTDFLLKIKTFSRSDPPGKAPLTRGRYVFQKGGEKREKKGEKEKRS